MKDVRAGVGRGSGSHYNQRATAAADFRVDAVQIYGQEQLGLDLKQCKEQEEQTDNEDWGDDRERNVPERAPAFIHINV